MLFRSIQHGVIPQDLKIAKVTPLHKKGSNTDCGNYRPVSILTTISKVMEKVIFQQMDSYLKENKILYEYQSGFRSAFSTDTCLIHLIDFIKQEGDNGKYTGMVLLDLQKAFDTVNHKILLQKLNAIGLGRQSIKWFESYLTGRTQVVDIRSEERRVGKECC